MCLKIIYEVNLYLCLSGTGTDNGTNFQSETKNFNLMLYVELEIWVAEESVIKIYLLMFIISTHTKQIFRAAERSALWKET